MEPTEEFRKSMIAQLDPGPKPQDRTWMVVAAVAGAVAVIALVLWLR